MANSSSSEDVGAPRDFHLSTSTDSDTRLSPNRQKCPLCRKFRKVFYCKSCLHSGLFYSTKQKITEGYIDKQKALLELEDNKKTLEKNCLKLLDSKQKSDVLNSRIRQAKDRIRSLRSAIDEKKKKKVTNNEKLDSLKERNRNCLKYLPRYEKKVKEHESCVSFKYDKLERIKENAREKQDKLKKLSRLRIQQLFKYIFPICVVNPTMETELSGDDMVNALYEASQTTFISDRWEYSDYWGELKYCIVGPTLPASGNYSAYNIWVAQNQDPVPGSNICSTVESNPAYTISAALTYTAQLVSILSYYLNIRLPYKMQYSDFCTSCMNEKQFTRRTARLNANILYLCFTQKVDLTTLNAAKTIHNILQLTKDPQADLGREGPIEYDNYRASILEEEIYNDLKTSDDSDFEEGDSFPVEWEAVPHVQCPEIAAGSVLSQSPQMIATQQASSMAGGLVTSAAASIASIWRGFTGR
ncbi:unnamed protein product [Phyllotreta striolata]|uniref:Beclin 1-associated autophagy-related key regulator n=1 Tax=Phyllotreta striolata TaxID=444603 RepID=A0A9N9TKL5_PHYSR|nr:unnamed protein product [Phyllotreta striolata]